MRTRNAEHRSLYFIKCTLPLWYCLISISNNSNIVGSKGGKKASNCIGLYFDLKNTVFWSSHLTLLWSLFAIVVEITVKHLTHHICSRSVGGKEGTAFSGTLHVIPQQLCSLVHLLLYVQEEFIIRQCRFRSVFYQVLKEGCFHWTLLPDYIEYWEKWPLFSKPRDESYCSGRFWCIQFWKVCHHLWNWCIVLNSQNLAEKILCTIFSNPKHQYRACIHEEGSIPAQLLHWELKNGGLRYGSVIDVESSLIWEVVNSIQTGVCCEHKVNQRLVFHLTHGKNSVI